MTIPNFSGDEDKDKISPGEWLRMIRKNCKTPYGVCIYLNGEADKWWYSFDKDTRRSTTWEVFEELFSNKWIKDSKMEEMYRIQDELKEEKEEIKKKNDEFTNMQSLNESLIKEVKNLKQEKSSKEKWEKEDSREELKKKDEEISRL
jgi:hypothetical protein